MNVADAATEPRAEQTFLDNQHRNGDSSGRAR